MASDKLTEKQEAFAILLVALGNAAEAYRQAYDVESNARDEWVYVEACRLQDLPKVALRIDELKEAARERDGYTVFKATEELEEARNLAHKEGQPGAAVSAINSKIKLYGLDKPTRHEVTGRDGEPLAPEATPQQLGRAMAFALAAAAANAEEKDGITDA